jgi:hypothetical protein
MEEKERLRLARNKASAKWYAANREKEQARRIAKYNANPNEERKRTYAWRRSHKAQLKLISDRARLARQARLAGRPRPKTCEQCGRPGRVCFDHCHESNEFRGWLCHKCNTVLGMVDDSPMLLRRLAKYLETAKKKADKCRQSKQ